MSKLSPLKDDGKNKEYWFHCPGCDCLHWVRIEGTNPVWEWNQSVTAPTFSPSVRVRMPIGDEMHVCHSFIREGKIEFLGDCTHELKGQTVEMLDWVD